MLDDLFPMNKSVLLVFVVVKSFIQWSVMKAAANTQRLEAH